MTPRRCVAIFCSGLLAAMALWGCGQIADPDRVRVAKINDEYITRGDLFKLLRDMGDSERPQIRNRNDLLRVLNQHIDRKLKTPLGKELGEEGTISVDRNVAREAFFSSRGDDEEMWRSIYGMEVPADGKITPLMRLYDLSPGSLEVMKNGVEQETDRKVRELLGDRAVEYLAAMDFKSGALEIDPKHLEREYELRKSEFTKFEWMRFVAVRFLTTAEAALEQATALRERIEAGENFESVIESYRNTSDNPLLRPAERMASVFESEIENDPALDRFRGFWTAASGAEGGAILGPVYMPQYRQIVQGADGRATAQTMPDAWLVLKVLEHRAETVKSLEECSMLLAPSLLVAAKMDLLRAENGVEIYEDKLPNPSAVEEELKSVVLR